MAQLDYYEDSGTGEASSKDIVIPAVLIFVPYPAPRTNPPTGDDEID